MGIRIAPDNNDIVVWKLDEAAAPFVNSSTSTSALSHVVSDLTTQSGNMQFQQPSPFAGTGANTSILFSGNNSSSPRNFISGANNVELTSPMSVSLWIYLRTFSTTGFVNHLIVKQHTTGSWTSGAFSVLTIQELTAGGNQYSFYSNGLPGTVAYWTMPLNMWCHIGFVYDGAFTYNYLNGNLVQKWAATGALNWGNHGPWSFGSIPAGSGNPEDSAFSVCDVRFANIARPQSYFQNVYNSGATTVGFGIPYTKYYKLRAYDLSCAEVTPVYWVSQHVNYSEAPVAPCGSLGPIEIMDSWEVVG